MVSKVKKMTNRKSYDVIFLEKRLKQLVMYESYELASTVKRWIDELSENVG